MPLKIHANLSHRSLIPKVERLFELSARKIIALEKAWDPRKGTPVFTERGIYTTRGWTEWTQGFQFGAALLQFEASGEKRFLEIGRRMTREVMASHVSHVGVHDHGFNNISTYGNLRRLMLEGKIPENSVERDFYELALKVSGAIQAARWTSIANGKGFIYSFNGPHSLFIDTMRSLRSLAVSHQLGHVLMGEKDQKISLLRRLLDHAQTTAHYAIYYGRGRDSYDVRGRTAHESIFNINDGSYRCPNSQQGYSPFTTWTRGLAWAICGFAEQLEFLSHLDPATFTPFGGWKRIRTTFEEALFATSDFYIESTPQCGVPMWDTGAPGLQFLPGYRDRPADPFNRHEPVDSSAAAIAAQGLLRLGSYLESKGDAKTAARYTQAGLTIAQTIFEEPYLSTSRKHQGLLLHSVYHRPNGWDYIAPGQTIPNGESSMWGDYHARELALMILRANRREPYQTFFSKPSRSIRAESKTSK